VILRMSAHGYGDFPSFIEKPSRAAPLPITSTAQRIGRGGRCHELTADGERNWPTAAGSRVGRMILEARSREALDEVLVIARPERAKMCATARWKPEQPADQAHVKVTMKRASSQRLKLWKWLSDRQGGEGETSRLSNRSMNNCCAKISSVCTGAASGATSTASSTPCGRAKWRSTSSPPAMSSSLSCSRACWQHRCKLGNRTARAVKSGRTQHQVYYPHPGAHLVKKPGRWIVAAKLETNACLVAALPPSSRIGWSKSAHPC